MPYGQYENTSFNGQTFTLGNVGLTGANGPDLVSSDPSKPVRVNGIIPGSGGGGGGDAFLNGGTDVPNAQEFTGFNRMNNDFQLADHLIFSEDGVMEKAKINATVDELNLITNEGTDKISMKLGYSVAVNTLELKEDTVDSTKNAL